MSKQKLAECLANVKAGGALVHNITNYVTVNDVANVILASGASPIMSDEPKDVEDITSICGGLNINIGTLNERTIEAMYLSGAKANELGHKVLLDPVGAGASALRTDTANGLLKKVKFDVVRGNVSEIKTLVAGVGTTKGVDADAADAVTEENLSCYVIRNGVPEMGRITGTGCQLSGMMTGFLVANPDCPLEAAAAAVCTMGLAGEIGLSRQQPGDGNSTLRNRIIDAISNMTPEQLAEGAKFEVK